MEATLSDLLTENLRRVFAERERSTRDAVISKLWHEDCVFIDPEGVHRGQKALSDAIDAVHLRFPGFAFNITSGVQEMSGVGRVSWALGPPTGPAPVTGTDVGVVIKGKIANLYA